MRAPGFWWTTPPCAIAWLLAPLGWLYGAITLRRMRRRGAGATVPVICVGNFVAGGAGKTPTVLALTTLLARRGERPFVLTRGYGGRLAGPIAVDPERHAAADVGDEALMMAAQVATIVARDRPAGAALAASLGASVAVMDDGLQNPSLRKQLRLAVVDGATGAGNGLCVPAGPLRAPLAGQLAETDAVIVIGPGEPGERVARQAQAAGAPVLRASLEIAPAAATALAGGSVLAVAGIGRPEKFAEALREAGAVVAGLRAYGDHHAYTRADVAAILADARAAGGVIATTAKDITKLGPLWPEAERHRLVVVPVTLVFAETGAIDALIDRVLAESRRR